MESVSPGCCRSSFSGWRSTALSGQPVCSLLQVADNFEPRGACSARAADQQIMGRRFVASFSSRALVQRSLEPLMNVSRGNAAILTASNVRATALWVSLALLSGVFAGGCDRKYGPGVAAVVNGQPIQRAEVEKYYRDNLGNAQQQPSKEQAETTRLNILRQLIDDEILQQRAAKLHLVATDEEVNAKLAEMKAPYTQEEFDQRLQRLRDDPRRSAAPDSPLFDLG